MEQLDLLVLRSARDWASEGHRMLLATVVRTWGSSPRPPGALMALREDGRTVGSVSGGCIEDDLVARYTRLEGGAGMPVGRPERLRYGVSADEAHRFGLPCGGTLELVLEFQPELTVLIDLVARLERGELVRRCLSLSDGQVTLTRGTVDAPLYCDDDRLETPLGPGYRLLLIGAGALAEYVATMALFNGFEVTVCDPRPEQRASWGMAGVHWQPGMPDDAVVAFGADSRSAVVALTHDPRLDDLALLAALESPAFYVGAIGSRRNDRNRRERLALHFGATPTTLTRLRGPIGLYIGSRTPAEIAVSVMAEILAVKNEVSLPAAWAVAQAKDSAEAIGVRRLASV